MELVRGMVVEAGAMVVDGIGPARKLDSSHV
jgi:hypothetical protein